MTVKRFFLLILTTFTFASFLHAKRSKLELLDDRDVSAVELRRRIRLLQETVMDLEARVENLEAKQGVSNPGSPAAPQKPASVTCVIETPFDGIYDATEVNEMKARVEAAKSCMSKVKSRIHCSAEKAKCGN